ncbi:hypothetical protein JE945_002478 [Flavobacterium psychrophilum]|nr:hypothetical protein [Flavobacterium psychrophilum]
MEHSENTKTATCDNAMLANRLFEDRLLHFRVFYFIENEVRCWSMNINKEFNRVSTPTISTEGQILGISQFTGSHDKNGNEIYEGDIVRLSEWFTPRNRPIIFDYYGSWNIGNLGVSFDQMKANGFVDCEIIGNIYMNPELLNND